MVNAKKQKAVVTSVDYRALIDAIPNDTAMDLLPDKMEHVLRLLACETSAKRTSVLTALLKDKFEFKVTQNQIKAYEHTIKEYAKQAALEARQSKIDSAENEPKIELLARDIKYEEVWASITKIGVTSSELLEIMMASCVSSCMSFSVPIWLIVIGNPSSLKTELIKLLKALQNVYFLSTLSENAFASGFIPPDGSDPKDLLPHLDGKALLIRDLTTLFSLNEETVKKILGDLTSIFDGEYEKFTATRGLIKYRSSFAMIACITPAILNKHHSYVHQLGSRFLFIRTPKLTDESRERGYKIAWSKQDRKKNINDATIITSSYCKQAMDRIKNVGIPIIDDECVMQWINTAADFIAMARGIVIGNFETFIDKKGEKGEKDGKGGKEVKYYEITEVQIEEPWRALNQLRNLATALAVLRGKQIVTVEECITLLPVVIATAPIDRAEIVDVLLAVAVATPKDIATRIDKSDKTVRRRLKELVALGLVEKVEQPLPSNGQWSVALYFLKDDYKNILSLTNAPPSDSLSVATNEENSNVAAKQGEIFPWDDISRAYKDV